MQKNTYLASLCFVHGSITRVVLPWKHPFLTFVTNFVLISQHHFLLLFSGFVQNLLQLLTAYNCPLANVFRMFPITCSPLPSQMLLVIQHRKIFTTLCTSPWIFQNVLTPWSDVIHRLSSVTSLLGSLLQHLMWSVSHQVANETWKSGCDAENHTSGEGW